MDGLNQALDAIPSTKDVDDVATLMVLVTELYADGLCSCERAKTPVDVLACGKDIGEARNKMHASFKKMVEALK